MEILSASVLVLSYLIAVNGSSRSIEYATTPDPVFRPPRRLIFADGGLNRPKPLDHIAQYQNPHQKYFHLSPAGKLTVLDDVKKTT